MLPKTLIICLDGCSPNYIDSRITPNIYRIGETGFFKKIKSAIPSVTNVNHATILSGSFPNEHGVIGNYYYDKLSGEQGFIEDPAYMKKESILDFYSAQGASTALLTVKGKVLDVFGSNVQIGISVQKPNPFLLQRLELEAPPAVSSPDSSSWIFKACYKLIQKENPDFIYCTTNDFMMHTYAPGTPEAVNQMKDIDEWIGRIYDLDQRREIYITADHGMNTKYKLVNMQKKLDKAGFDVMCLLPLKDRYLENHRYQEGGALYIYSQNPEQQDELIEFLQSHSFIEKIYTREEASFTFNLPKNTIGDLFLVADSSTAFAETEEEELFTRVRTHGSLHEQEIPLIAVNARLSPDYYTHSRDIVKYMFEEIRYGN